MEKEDLFRNIIGASNEYCYYYSCNRFNEEIIAVKKENIEQINKIENQISEDSKDFIAFKNPNRIYEKIDLYQEKLDLIKKYKNISHNEGELLASIYQKIIVDEGYYKLLCEKFNFPLDFDENILFDYLSSANNINATNEIIIKHKNHLSISKLISESKLSYFELVTIINDLYLNEFYLACVILSIVYSDVFEFELLDDIETSNKIHDSFKRVKKGI